MASRELDLVLKKKGDLLRPFLEQKPVKLGSLAKLLGLTVTVAPLPTGISGMIMYEDGSYKIKINKFESRERQRFTLAHEIAHYLLHKDIIKEIGSIKDNVLYRSGQPEKIEYEANRLASDILLPDALIEKDLKKCNFDNSRDFLHSLSEEWQVSKAAMEVKLSAM